MPLALPLAVLTFIGGFIPIVGALFAGVLSVLVALVSNGFTAALIVLGIVLLVQQVEGNVLQPILQGKSLQLHAAVVLLAVTAGSSLYGIAGAFLAVPVAAAGATVLRYLFAQADKTSEGDATDAPADPEAAEAAGVPPAPDPARAAAARADDDGLAADGTAMAADGTARRPVRAGRTPVSADGPGRERPATARPGTVAEPRADAPNPEQLEISDDPEGAILDEVADPRTGPSRRRS